MLLLFGLVLGHEVLIFLKLFVFVAHLLFEAVEVVGKRGKLGLRFAGSFLRSFMSVLSFFVSLKHVFVLMQHLRMLFSDFRDLDIAFLDLFLDINHFSIPVMSVDGDLDVTEAELFLL